MLRTYFGLFAAVVFMSIHPVIAMAQGGRSQSAPKPTSTAIVNINTASASELEALPGVGPKTAGRIVEYRQKNGPFKKIEEVMNVRGFGEKNFLKLKSQLTIGTVAKADASHSQP